MISKATGVYIIMLVVFGAGLWAILSFGSIKLHAPTDLAGNWELRTPARGDATNDTPAHVMTVEQSGRFVRVAIDNSQPISMEFAHDGVNAAGLAQIKLVAGGRSAEDSVIILDGKPDADEYKASLNGLSIEGEWLAIRTLRTYPKHVTDQPATRPAAAAPATTHARL